VGRFRTLVAALAAVAVYMCVTTAAFAAVPTTVYSSGNVNVPIPAGAPGVTSGAMADQVISVPDLGQVYDVNVKLRLDHTYDSDLAISLQGPDGTTIALSTNRGGNWDNFGSGAQSCSGIKTTFDSDASRSLIQYDPPWAGTFRPEGNLDAFRGRQVNGNWTLHINDGAPGDYGALFCWQLVIARDSTGPTVPVIGGAMIRHFQTTTTFYPAWHSSDPESGVAAYYPFWVRRPYNAAGFTTGGDFGGPTRATTKKLAGTSGNTYCVQAYARNFVNLFSNTSAYKCTSVPVNNTDLTASAGWTQKTGTGFYKNTYSQSKTHGATLTLNGVIADQLAVIATKCPGCGVIDVLWGGIFLKRFNLNATTLLKKRILVIPAFGSPNQTNNLTISVASTNKPVRIEGVGVLNHE
jgi:subtilisin-like proprotein convertase family protein